MESKKSKRDKVNEYRRNNRDKIRLDERKRLLKKKYGITIIQYNEMFTSQNGECYICGTHQDKLRRALAVDHSHHTGKVRGLLCDKCNSLLGYENDNIETLKKAIEYLETNN